VVLAGGRLPILYILIYSYHGNSPLYYGILSRPASLVYVIYFIKNSFLSLKQIIPAILSAHVHYITS
jgi:hypothetical protein